MRREKLEHLMTTGMIERKRSIEKYVEWTIKMVKFKTSDRCTERDRDAWKLMIAFTKKQATCLIEYPGKGELSSTLCEYIGIVIVTGQSEVE